MRVTPTPAPHARPPLRAMIRIALAGAACALLVIAGGWGIQRALLGASEADARMRAETDVRRTFGEMLAALAVASQAVDDAALVRAAAADDADAAQRLFNAARGAVAEAGAGADAALTVFSAEGVPLAWAGRPSEPSPERLAGGETWFLSRVALGPRIVHVRPVIEGGVRLGTIVAERVIVPAGSTAGAPAGGLQGANAPITVPTVLAPVSVQSPSTTVTQADASTFVIDAPSGEPLLTAIVAAADLRATRERWQSTTRSIALFVVAVAIVLMAGPLLDWRNRSRRITDYAVAAVLTAAVIVLARIAARWASPADWSDRPLFSAREYAGTVLPQLLTSPFDFLLTAAMAAGLVGLVLFAIEAWRLRGWRRRRRVRSGSRTAVFAAIQLGAGALVAAVLVGHERMLQDTIATTNIDLLEFSLQRWNAARVALQVGLVVAHATALGAAVAVLRASTARWSIPRGDWGLRALAIACWLVPLAAWRLSRDWEAALTAHLPLLAAAGAAILLALSVPRMRARYRHGSQAFRLTLLTLGLVAPAFAFYPTVFQLAWRAKLQLVETRFGPQALNQRENVARALEDSLAQIDTLPNLVELVSSPATRDGETMADRAFQVWQATALATYPPATSSVELFGPDRRLVSRFAFNLPEDLSAPPVSEESRCDWDAPFEEVNPFFAEERRILHAGRQICGPDGRVYGSIIVYAMLTDYENLPFIATRSPYIELNRPEVPGVFTARDVEYAVYGWSRRPLFASGDTAWPMPDDVFAQVVESREPIWAEVRRGSRRFAVFIQNDRGGIYALGFPVVSVLDHLVHLAELTVLAAVTFLLLLASNAVLGMLARRSTPAPALLREIRASFYRKLFIAFVLAVIVPVVALAVVTRNYVADRIRTNIEEEANRTASAAARVVRDLAAPVTGDDRIGIDDNLMVWVSRLIDQDVNVFFERRLLATSERNLFLSGFLPTRTPAEVYEALELRREAATVVREQLAGLNPYLVAAIPLVEEGILTVPLTSRQPEIEAEIETLDRRVLLASLIFIFGGSMIGYWFAERISDPVNRLTRATRRIARGDLDARIAATSSDELRRLVEDFNSMARDLQRQRGELERTNRLEAWAEMARQVAHEIKNPLTPIQLNAEHLRRVHADRGAPLTPVLQDCVETILTQVKLLRQIASEFSSFASSPTAKPSTVDVPDLLHEIVDPYRAGLSERIRFDVDVPDALPPVHVDRTLIARSLTNIVENALHAMPGSGTLAVVARADDHRVRIRVSDTGVGMDPEALARAFEPYFSTKATGTGLGLPIAKRNVELTGGTITVASERDRGTTVELTLPVSEGSSVGGGGSGL